MMMNKYIKYSLLVLVLLIIGLGYYFMKDTNGLFSSEEMSYTCPMPQDSVFSKEPGKCPKCGMELIPIKKENSEAAVYTCSMHPQIIKEAPGKCPICGMDLVRKVENKKVDNEVALEHLLQSTSSFVVGDYPTVKMLDTILNSVVKLPGEIMYDPNSTVNVAARISGRIEKMYVHYKFQKVSKGQKLFDLYSPELATEQQNFIYLVTNDGGNNAILSAAKQKLALYGMTAHQISALAMSKKSNPIVTIYSPANGIVQGTEGMAEKQGGAMKPSSETTAALAIKEGDYIQKNAIVFRLANTDKVWGVFNVPDGKSRLVKANQAIQIKTEIDDETISAKVNFVETQLNASDKTNRIRVYLNNAKNNFPIGLRLEGSVSANSSKGMWLPKEALVSTGNNKVAFVKTEGGFKAQLVQTGITVNDFVQIVNGLSVDDAVVQNAQYLMDSETFIKATRY